MAGQTVTNVVKAEIRYSMQGNNAENVLHVLCDGVPTLLMINEINGVIGTWLLGEWAPLAAPEWKVNEIVLTDLTSLSGIRRSFPREPAVEGTATGQALPANATIAVKADIGTRGRGKSGRVFWCGLSEEMVDGNILSNTTAAAIVSALEELRSDMIAVTDLVGLCVPHYVVNGIRPPVCTASVVQGFTMADTTIDSQRDRLPGHKRHKRRTP